jgi:nitric oxide reductase subunit C
MFTTICAACHSVGGVGGVVGPALDEVYKRKTREEMLLWIADPQTIKPGTAMPQIEMSEEQRAEIVDFLMSLASAPAPVSAAPQEPVNPEISYE